MSWFNRDPGRPLTSGERALACSVFGAALAIDPIRLHRACWWPLQPRNVVMAPDGGIWFHPAGALWRDDFAHAHPRLQELLVHELTHVWQHQQGINLLLRRHPFCRYRYALKTGKPLRRYGIEQQAMIVEHAYTARREGCASATLDALVAQIGTHRTDPLPGFA